METPLRKKFFILSTFGELCDVALYLQNVEHCEVIFSVPDPDSSKIGDGLLKKDDRWWEYVGKDYIWVIDGCEHGELQTYLRDRGEFVFGNGGKRSEDLENDRQLGQRLLKLAGFHQPESRNFKDIDEAINFIEKNKDRLWVLKQNANAPKSINYLGKFPNNIDMLYHLNSLKKRWSESEYGAFDCDLMEKVDGTEIAASAFFNGTEFLKNGAGKVCGWLNFEEKKQMVGGLGTTCGEMGTTFITVDEDNSLFRDIIMKPKIIEALKQLNYRGVFDINGCKTKKGYVAFEFTMRPGIPATSYEFIEGLDMPTSELIEIVARGESKPIKLRTGTGMVIVIASKPFPVEVDLEVEATSLGERLWILEDGVPVKDFTTEQRKHIHLENIKKVDSDYLVASKNGYLLTVTGRGKNIKETRDMLIQYIKDNIYISDIMYRTDIGVRVEKDTKKGEEENFEKEMQKIKEALRQAIYE